MFISGVNGYFTLKKGKNNRISVLKLEFLQGK